VDPDRRRILLVATSVFLAPARLGAAIARMDSQPNILSPPLERVPMLNSAPIELAGAWGRMLPGAAENVLERMRSACLEGVRLLSERQPDRIRVDEHPSGPPAIWLHRDESRTAWIIVDIGERAWSQLAYQFGHELGHVLANSWQSYGKPGGPCQWLEESLVEAFSLRGLGKLASSWKRDPPFPKDNAYGAAIASYRHDVEEKYRKLAAGQGGAGNLAEWYRRHRPRIEAGDGLNEFAQAASLQILEIYERTPNSVEAIGALNRWPGRSHLPLTEYLREWGASCGEIGASTELVDFLRKKLAVSRSRRPRTAD
jgi:hypothetical protein